MRMGPGLFVSSTITVAAGIVADRWCIMEVLVSAIPSLLHHVITKTVELEVKHPRLI